ncbi:hypothetical protein MASR2M18_20880 [Ignavibacteria bacterium]|nr:flagellar protein FlgN [Bacteroidota bacterium]MCZ2131981.1 flagellar protein FlgN [Bacteroidota bacterium]
MMNTLITLLEEETALLQSLVGAAMRQQQALIRLRVPELEDANAEQEKILGQIRLTERQRMRTLSSELGITDRDATTMSLSAIISKTESDERKALIGLQEKLSGLTRQLQEINAINRVLTHRARTSVREVMSFIEDNNVQVCNVRI